MRLTSKSANQKRIFAALLAFGLLAALALPVRADSPGPARQVRLSLLPDFEHGRVDVDGTLSPSGLPAESARLVDWGVGTWQAARQGEAWHVYGSLDGAQVTATGEGTGYRLTVGPLSLAPGDSLDLVIPFASIAYAGVSPPPDNLDDLQGPVKPRFPALRYAAGSDGRTLRLDIPFTPPRQEILLRLTPLPGPAGAFRLSGEARFEGLSDYDEFERHCVSARDSPFFRYRAAHLLFVLDYPPAYHFGFLNQVYQYKPTYSLLRSDLLACGYEAGGGWVQATFTGRVFSAEQNRARYPESLSAQDVVERRQPYTGFGRTAGEYEVQLGEVVLGPGDVLTAIIPLARIEHVSPPPSRFSYDQAGDTQITYRGPRRFALSIRYTPESGLLLRQAPVALRAGLSPLESWWSSLLNAADRPERYVWTGLFLLAGLILALTAQRLGGRLWVGYAAWLLAAAALLYALRGVFGWLLLAVGWCALYTLMPLDRIRLARSVIAGLAVGLALVLDARRRPLRRVEHSRAGHDAPDPLVPSRPGRRRLRLALAPPGPAGAPDPLERPAGSLFCV